jgi:hypothetical protein
MDFNQVLIMREEGGPFAGGLFLIAWFFIKTWMLWIGLIIGNIIAKRSIKLDAEHKNEE